MKTNQCLLLVVAISGLSPLFSLCGSEAQRDPGTAPEGLSGSDWLSIRAAYEAGRHQFLRQEDGTYIAHNPGLGWRLTFDESGFVATDGSWTWGLELEGTVRSNRSCTAHATSSNHRLSQSRSPHLTEWFINDQRGLEQGWTLTAPAEIRLRVRGTLKAVVSEQSVRFGDQITYSGLKAWDATGKILPTHFEATPEGFAVRYDDTGAQYPLTIDPIAQNAYLKASNTGGGDEFGRSVAVSGDTVVVGAPNEDSNATGVNGDSGDNSAVDSGAVYVFVRSGAGWSQQAYLKASNSDAFDLFGYSVAVSGDTVVVGALFESGNDNSVTNSGAAYVFVRRGTAWSQQAYLKASNAGQFDQFGYSVSVSGDTVVVGARAEDSNATGVDGNGSDNSTSGSGAAYVFMRSGSAWSQQAYLKASSNGEFDQFGWTVAVSGDTVLVGSPGEDSNATGINGNGSDNSVSGSGAAYVFVRSGATWSQQAYLKASNTGDFDQFGYSVAVSGDTLVAGASGERSNATGVNGNGSDNSAGNSGAAYVFVRHGTVWSQQAYLKASNTGTSDQFGYAVAVSGDTVVVGAYLEDSNATGVNGNSSDNSASGSGSAYVFVRSGTTWSQQAYLKASNTSTSDQFGYAVAVSFDTVVVGANEEDSSATGMNGDGGNNSAGDSGAAYVFRGLGVVLPSLSRTGYSAPGVADISYKTPSFPAVNGVGRVLFDHLLDGAGAAGGKARGIFSTLAPASTVDLVFQQGSALAGIGGFGPGTKATTLGAPVCNRPGQGLFLATASGHGVNAANNRVLLKDDGNFVSFVRRTGQPVTELGGAVPSAFSEVLQNETLDLIAIPYKLQASAATTPAVTRTNDSGLLLLNHAGALVTTTGTPPREGDAAYGGGGTFGQFSGRAVSGALQWAHFGAFFIPDTGRPVAALFETLDSGVGNKNLIAKVGDTAPGAVPATATFSSFPGFTQINGFSVYRAKLKGAAASENEGIWRVNVGLYVLKGTDLASAGLPGVRIASILRFWPIDTVTQMVVQVTLTGTGVTAANKSALLLRQSDGNFLVLLRTGDRAPGAGPATVQAIQAVDVNCRSGHYAVLGSLKGAKSSDNQALWAGRTVLGDNGSDRFKRLPSLRLRKGERYLSTATPLGTIKGLSLKPAVDPTGAGGRGLAQVVGSGGHIVVGILTDRKVTEQVLLGP